MREGTGGTPLQAATGEKPVSSLPDEIEEIFRAHHGLIFRVAYRITGSATEAEDVLQTVFLRLLARNQPAPLAEHREGYLRRAAVNASLDVLRRRRGQEQVESLEDFPDLAHRDARELEDVLRRSIARLRPPAAEIFVLRFLEGHSYAEIARMLGVSQVRVAVTLHRTRRRLKKELRPFL